MQERFFLGLVESGEYPLSIALVNHVFPPPYNIVKSMQSACGIVLLKLANRTLESNSTKLGDVVKDMGRLHLKATSVPHSKFREAMEKAIEVSRLTYCCKKCIYR